MSKVGLHGEALAAGVTGVPARTAARKTAARSQLPTIEKVVQATAGYFLVTASQIYLADRRQYVAHPRKVACWLLHRRYGVALSTIGEALGRVHTTVLAACRSIDRMRQVDTIVSAQIAEVEKEIYGTKYATARERAGG